MMPAAVVISIKMWTIKPKGCAHSPFLIKNCPHTGTEFSADQLDPGDILASAGVHADLVTGIHEVRSGDK